MQCTMAIPWTEEETLKLIELWGEDNVQAQLEGCKRNAQVFERISCEMKDIGYDRTGVQCREKIKKLRGEYKKIKDKKGKTGEGNKPWKYFEYLDSVLGHKPATCPPIVVDTSSTCTAVEDDETLEKEVASAIQGDEQTENQETGTSAATPRSSRSSTPTFPPAKKARKTSKTEKSVQAVREVVDQLLEFHKEAEIRQGKIEERRLQLEEKMAEREDQRRQEEFLLLRQMMSMVARPSHNSFTSSSSIPTQLYPMGRSLDPLDPLYNTHYNPEDYQQ